MKSKYTRLKFACYSVNIAMAVISSMPPLLFLTFRSLYGLSFSQLGLLALVNYVTQLSVDLIFSFFSHKFNINKTLKLTPVIYFMGLVLYAVLPALFPQAVFAGLLTATVVFSASGGLSEVLISPVIAAIPSDNPDREMSRLHSVYAWGVVGVIVVSTLFIMVAGAENWQLLALIFSLVPLTSAVLFIGTEIPKMKTPEKVSGAVSFLKNKGMWLCVLAIFLGGAVECTMAQWSSGYLEQALKIPKTLGDIFGTAMFAVMLGIGRMLYAKIGKNIERTILLGAVGALICYLAAALCDIPLVGLAACALTGFCVSMLWPGNLIIASEHFPNGGVFIYAMMAAGGDLGASVGPQVVGFITDAVINTPSLTAAAQSVGILPEQLGMKVGVLVGAIFPLAAIPLYLSFIKRKEKTNA